MLEESERTSKLLKDLERTTGFRLDDARELEGIGVQGPEPKVKISAEEIDELLYDVLVLLKDRLEREKYVRR